MYYFFVCKTISSSQSLLLVIPRGGLFNLQIKSGNVCKILFLKTARQAEDLVLDALFELGENLQILVITCTREGGAGVPPPHPETNQ